MTLEHSAYGLLEFTLASLIPFLFGVYVGRKNKIKSEV